MGNDVSLRKDFIISNAIMCKILIFKDEVFETSKYHTLKKSTYISLDGLE